ncbi:hypothetical protein [Natrinema longum]|uniref:DUF8135 domain-containing protein n=1 Tax=Natrinema longum TaxID=370324 RepID=A0A8A2UBV6_9EURY|nr:hypothetical protein [Natrinema longum]MBZ6495872.1 hypothetical protein [Natrinema longum]QSW86186.1 hypothetical protein J0X27_05035 [Natrinema longum]
MTDRSDSAAEDRFEFTDPDESNPPAAADPGEGDDDPDPMADADSGGDTDAEGGRRSAPLGDLAASAEGAADGTDSDRSPSSAPDFDELFDRQQTGEIDGDRLWARLEAADADGLPDEPDGRVIREVEKRSYCQGCDYFSDPPDVACAHEDAEILTVPSVSTFRVADCPFVLEDEVLERTE